MQINQICSECCFTGTFCQEPFVATVCLECANKALTVLLSLLLAKGSGDLCFKRLI